MSRIRSKIGRENTVAGMEPFNATTSMRIDKSATNRHCTTVSEVPDNRALAHRIDLLEERMNTNSAEIEGAAERLRADMERHRTDMAKRDAANTRWMIGAIAAAIVIILGGVRLIVGG